MDIGIVRVTPVLILLVASALFAAYWVVPGLCSDASSSSTEEPNSSVYGDEWYRMHGVPVPVPFPDEEINSYIGKVYHGSVIGEIGRLIEEKYPGHQPLIKFKVIESEERWGIDRGGQPTLYIHFQKILIVEILDCGALGPNGGVLEPPVAAK